MLSERILIVDDEAEVRRSLFEALSEQGYRVDVAESAEDALRRFEEASYAVLLTDLHLPGGPSGLELIGSVKQRSPLTLCVIITGYATLEFALSALKSQAYDLIRKPFKLAEVEAVLDRALEYARLLRELEDYRQQLEAKVLARTQALHQVEADALRLCDAVRQAQGGRTAEEALSLFGRLLVDRWHPDGWAICIAQAEAGERPKGYRTLVHVGRRPFPETFPGDPEGKLPYPESFAIPFALAGRRPGAWLCLGFEERSSFISTEPAFQLFVRHLELAWPDLRRLQGRSTRQPV